VIDKTAFARQEIASHFVVVINRVGGIAIISGEESFERVVNPSDWVQKKATCFPFAWRP